MEQQGWELDRREELVGKWSTRRPKRAYNLPQRSNRAAHTTAARAQTQGPLIKDLGVEDPKFKPQEPKSTASQRSDNAESSEKARKENKNR